MSDMTEKWQTTDDRGTVRWLIVDYDEQDCAHVTRDALRELLTLAGMRLTLDVEESA